MTTDAREELRALVQPVLRATAVYGSGCAGLGAAIADGKARPPNPDGTPLVPIEPVERAAMLVVARARAEALLDLPCMSGFLGDCTEFRFRTGNALPREKWCAKHKALAAAEVLVAELETQG